jgi:hypothetical protein
MNAEKHPLDVDRPWVCVWKMHKVHERFNVLEGLHRLGSELISHPA